MSLSGSRQGLELKSNLEGKGMVGSDLGKFCNAIGNGSEKSVVGKTFTTMDVGLLPGAGVGVGSGLTGIVSAIISSAIISAGISMGLVGSDFPKIADAAAITLEQEMLQATLSSTHTPIFEGIGNIVPGSIPVQLEEWANNINTEGIKSGFVGQDWNKVAKAIATGFINGFLTATGQVTITGTCSFIPFSGTGVGSGVIS